MVHLSPVHTGDYSRRFKWLYSRRKRRQQFVTEFGDSCRKRRQSPNSKQNTKQNQYFWGTY